MAEIRTHDHFVPNEEAVGRVPSPAGPVSGSLAGQVRVYAEVQAADHRDELHLFFASSRDEAEWAVARTDCDEHLLAQLSALKSYQRMGCFPKLEEIPETVVDFVRRAVELPEGTVPRAANRTAERQRTAVRQRTGLSYGKAKARKTAEAVMRSEAVSKNRPADLINIALEKVVEAGPELPGFTTLDALAAKIRTEVNASICMGVYDQLSEVHRDRLLALLSEKDEEGRVRHHEVQQAGADGEGPDVVALPWPGRAPGVGGRAGRDRGVAVRRRLGEDHGLRR
ncbi:MULTISPECIES: DUF4158 domain-containing protein [Streptomyces]|uniref:DUF4158 domain-containing protein n=1 Tax=Streptomyces TaxID=1883 RepID=UPI00166FFCDA|nr:DUF4158 domain-containing protein [Streptomyces ruber]